MAKNTTSNGTATKAQEKGLRKPQERILKALAASAKALTRGQLAEKAKVDQAMCTEYLGSLDDAKRAANDARYFPSLITLGLVTYGQAEDENMGTAYKITAKGKQAAAKVGKEPAKPEKKAKAKAE